MRKQSQNERILDHLIQKKTINPLQALNLYGCFRLSSRIFDLKEQLELTRCLDCRKKYTKPMTIEVTQTNGLRLCIKCFNRREYGEITKDEFIRRRI